MQAGHSFLCAPWIQGLQGQFSSGQILWRSGSNRRGVHLRIGERSWEGLQHLCWDAVRAWYSAQLVSTELTPYFFLRGGEWFIGSGAPGAFNNFPHFQTGIECVKFFGKELQVSYCTFAKSGFSRYTYCLCLTDTEFLHFFFLYLCFRLWGDECCCFQCGDICCCYKTLQEKR